MKGSRDRVHATYVRAGAGVFAGVLVALASQLVWGAQLWALGFLYGIGIARLRGWKELAAILTMIGTPIAYFAVYEVVDIDGLRPALTVALSALVVVMFCGYVLVVASSLGHAAAHGAPDWERRWFAVMRRRQALGQRARPSIVRLFSWLALAFAVGMWVENRALESAVIGIAFFQALLFYRLVLYWRRLEQQGADMVIGTSPRRPILFLRPFGLDALPVSPIRGGWRDLLMPDVGKP